MMCDSVNGVTCDRCGRPMGKFLRNCMAVASEASPGLGDIVATGLSAVGITKERVSKLLGGDCGCEERQQKLNELGHKYLGIGSPTPSGPLDG